MAVDRTANAGLPEIDKALEHLLEQHSSEILKAVLNALALYTACSLASFGDFEGSYKALPSFVYNMCMTYYEFKFGSREKGKDVCRYTETFVKQVLDKIVKPIIEKTNAPG